MTDTRTLATGARIAIRSIVRLHNTRHRRRGLEKIVDIASHHIAGSWLVNGPGSQFRP